MAVYVGNGKIVSTKFGDMTKLSMHKDDINRIVKYMKETKSDWVNLDLKEKREPAQGKPTHYLEINQYKPEKQSANNAPVQKEQTKTIIEEMEHDELPF